MSKYDTYLQTEHDKCQAVIVEAQEKSVEMIGGDINQLQRNSMENIPQQFGEFLYVALGDRVTGQRSSVVNKTYVEKNPAGVDLAKRASDAGVSIEDQARAEQTKPLYPRRGWERNSSLQLWITVGRKFGVSYPTGDGSRVHTKYFGAGLCFKYLTQEHVDCVKNRLKRECVQSFLDFRNDFIEQQNELVDQLIPTPIPVNLGVVSCVMKTKKINSRSGSYNDDTKTTYTVMDGVVCSDITHTIATINKVALWDKHSTIDHCSSDTISEPTFVSLTFINMNDADRSIKIIGNVDLSMKECATSMQTAHKYGSRNVLNHIACVMPTHSFGDQPALKAYSNYNVQDAEGVLLNMHEVLEHPAIRAEMDKRISFYNKMSDRLQQLKHQNATLYFVNADM